MPKGALFHLHCLTRGEKEQVFHIENGVQVFVRRLGFLSIEYSGVETVLFSSCPIGQSNNYDPF